MEPIPHPRGVPLLGNIFDIDPSEPFMSISKLADTYGSIFQLNFAGRKRIIISSHEFLNEICDETRFEKSVSGPLEEIRNCVSDGLFTAWPEERNWGIAHRALMPSFGPLSIRNMFDEMLEVLRQMILKWARFGSEHKIHVTDDFTRLTLDSIALCAMDFRFNSFYKDELHPFVDAMIGLLTESEARSRRPKFASWIMTSHQKRYDRDIAFLKKVSQDIIDERRKTPVEKKDLLNALLYNKDPQTGEGLTDDSIINNMITFLVAGHETTSGMLSFLFYQILKHPETYRKAQEEVDQVLGKETPTLTHLSQLPYLSACLRETLRLTPTAPAFFVEPKRDGPPQTLGGRYEVPLGVPVIALLGRAQQDPAVFGEDAEEFEPERMLDEQFNKLPKNCWKPFGNGARACIGRPFAWQEALLATAALLQVFDFTMDNPKYQLEIQSTLTIKPKDFFMHARLRPGFDVASLERLYSNTSLRKPSPGPEVQTNGTSNTQRPMSIFYGSNSGTCEMLANSLANAAAGQGYSASVAPMDSATKNLLKDTPVVFITASYEGQPPDNAARFVEWISQSKEDLADVKFAVFGCGHRDWQATFQRIPILLDTTLEKLGATRLAERGLADAASDDMFGTFDTWQDESFWPAIQETFGVHVNSSKPGLDVEISSQMRSKLLRQNVKEAVVLERYDLTSGDAPQKCHIKVQLPTGMTYRAGDYLNILPINNNSTVRRVLKKFHVPWDAMITIKPTMRTTLPTDIPVSANDILSSYVELNQPATKRNISAIAERITEVKAREELMELSKASYDEEILQKRVSVLDLLERFPDTGITFGEFLSLVPAMRIRQYSISSSPLYDATTCSLTYSVLDEEAFAGGRRHLGVASNYLSKLEVGEKVQVSVRQSHQAFHLPLDIENIPIIMVCAGSGVSPFRGFVQERVAQLKAGRKLAPAMLFYGCRDPETDHLYKAEMEEWQALGAVDLRLAYSNKPEASEGCKYVQDRVWHDRVEATTLFSEQGRIYVCGSAEVGSEVSKVIKKAYLQAENERGEAKTEEDIEEWFQRIRNVRFATDVFT